MSSFSFLFSVFRRINKIAVEIIFNELLEKITSLANDIWYSYQSACNKMCAMNVSNTSFTEIRGKKKSQFFYISIRERWSKLFVYREKILIDFPIGKFILSPPCITAPRMIPKREHAQPTVLTSVCVPACAGNNAFRQRTSRIKCAVAVLEEEIRVSARHDDRSIVASTEKSDERKRKKNQGRVAWERQRRRCWTSP